MLMPITALMIIMIVMKNMAVMMVKLKMIVVQTMNGGNPVGRQRALASSPACRRSTRSAPTRLREC